MQELNDDNFNECILESDDFSLVVFCATDCRSCNQLVDLLEKIEKDYDVLFYKYSVDRNFEFAKRYNVMSLPTMLVFKCGAPAGQLSGYSSNKKSEEFVNECFCKI